MTMESMYRNPKFKKILKSLVIGFIILGSLILTLTLVFNAQKESFLSENNLSIFKERIPSYDGKLISSYVIMNTGFIDENDENRSAIIIVHGVNEQKEDHVNRGINLAKHGFISVIIDLRGHGETNTPSSLGYYEVDDISATIDWIDETLNMVNASNVGLLGASLGGLISLIAQTKDDRIKATVTLSAPGNMTSVVNLVNLDEIITKAPELTLSESALRIRSPLYHMNENNTKNLLIIHGTEDDLVDIQQAEDLYNTVDGPSRVDIDYISQAGNHGGVILNILNEKITLVWFSYYLLNQPLDIGNLESEAAGFTLIMLPNFPYSLINIFLLVFCAIELVIISYLISKKKQENDEMNSQKLKEMATIEASCPMRTPGEIRKIFGLLIAIFFGSYIASLLIGIFTNNSVIDSFFLYPPLIGLPILIISIYKIQAFACGTWDMINLKLDLGSKEIFSSILITVIPFITYILLTNTVFGSLLESGYPIWNATFIRYTFVFGLSVYYDLFFIKSISNISGTDVSKWINERQTTALGVSKFIVGFLIFIAFRPINFMGYTISVNAILFLLSVGGGFLFIAFIRFYQRFNKNLIAAVLLNSLIISAFLVRNYVRAF